MKTSNQLFLLSVLSVLSAVATAADSASGAGQADTSQWKCESCTFDQGLSGTLDVGVGSVSEKSAKFGEYNGLDKKGGFLIGDGAVRSRGEDGAYWNLNASNLGLKSRSLDAEGGQQGKYKLLLKYDEIPHFISDSAQTPFAGSGGASLTLPAGYPAATTANMPLAGTLQQVEIGTDRKRLGMGASWTPVRDWEYAVNFRHETKEGTKRTAGAFFVNAAQLVEPVDYVTDQVDASASYSGGKWQAKLAYYGSTFRNNNDSLNWQNPFTFLPGFPGAGAGQLALPPDNQFHQVLASAGYQFSERTRASADIALGRMTQNDGFLASTQNATLAVAALPGSSLNGRADTLDANLKLSSAVTDRLRLNAAYTHNDRDNRTPQSLYPSVATDMFTGAPRANLPYGFTQEKFRLSADYKVLANTKVFAGVDSESRKRTFQEVDRSREDTVWGKIASRILDKADLSLRFAHGERRNSGYQVVSGIAPPENPLLRKYNMASRTRETVAVRADISIAENVNLGLGLDTSNDDYLDSAVGLLSGRDLNLNGDVSVILTQDTSLHLFANHQEIKSRQAGSQTFSIPDWSGENKDRIDFFGIGLKHVAIKDKLEIGADYGSSRSKGEISVNTGALNPAFPNLSTTLDSLKLYASYRLKDKVSLQASYWHERYDSKNWMLDGVASGTIPNILTLGEQAPRYSVNVFRLALRYKF
ncbi:MAG: MtrB/PioB family decaheme-associated outer membrane protein [Betaproteobacteria bacterium]|nr:MtrB/PioB family decaheme-associated outer membrane protein [Betaproteobacteria bacterium]